jgi:hypothetical protein
MVACVSCGVLVDFDSYRLQGAPPGDAGPDDSEPGRTAPADTEPGDAGAGDTTPGDAGPDTEPCDADAEPGNAEPPSVAVSVFQS